MIELEPQKNAQSKPKQTSSSAYPAGGDCQSDMPSGKAQNTMANPQNLYDQQEKEFLEIFSDLAPYKHRYEVFRDFVIMVAISLHNALLKDDKREQEYLLIINSYKREDIDRFPRLMAVYIELMTHEPRDVLGILMGKLDLMSEDKAQFFTPETISDLMAQINFEDMRPKLDKGFITLSDPACGGGGLLLRYVKQMIEAGYNPSEKLWVSAIDIDRMTALICYIQLTLWHIPAEVVVGNTLSMEIREIWYTPAHHLGFWNTKLERREEEKSPSVPQEKAETQTQATKQEGRASQNLHKENEAPAPQQKPVQYDFGF